MPNVKKAREAVEKLKSVAVKAATVSTMRSNPPKGKPEPAEKIGASIGAGNYIVKKSALSLDVGPKIVAEWFGDVQEANELTAKLHQLQSTAPGSKNYTRLAKLTDAVMKAAKADSNINLAASYLDNKKDIQRLNELLYIAIGLKTVVETEDKNGTMYPDIQYAPAVASYFPQTGDKPADDPAAQKRENFRGNFSTMFKKVIRAAHALIEKDVTIKHDKSGTLQISGPAVVKHFGADNVLLNEQKKIDLGGGKTKELHVKPSFTELGAMGAATIGVAVTGGDGGQHRTRQSGTADPAVVQANQAAKTQTPAMACATLCQMLVKAIEKVTGPADKVLREALESAANAIEVKLENG